MKAFKENIADFFCLYTHNVFYFIIRYNLYYVTCGVM